MASLVISCWFLLAISMGVGFAYLATRDYRRGWVRRYSWFGERLDRDLHPLLFWGQVGASVVGVAAMALIVACAANALVNG